MRAGRLINMLLLLQRHGRMTAPRLADELEVSTRTVLRDVEALNSAGVPIYTVRGSGGGIELLEGFRTTLTGLSRREAEALFVAAVPNVAAELGLSDAATAARLKLLGALPAALRSEAESLSSWFHHDPIASTERIPHQRLPRLVAAIKQRRKVRLDEAPTSVCALGIVLQAGVWHLLIRDAAGVGAVRVSEISQLRVTSELFELDDAPYAGELWSELNETMSVARPGV